MEKSLRVHKQLLAERDLIDIWQYTMLNWGEVQADTYLDELDLAISRIA
jgi:plasmid stabilization system protein ParE